MIRTTLKAAVLSAAFLACAAGALSAQEYVIGVDDVLAVTVWQRDDLSRTLTVRSTGRVTFPPVGEIRASGLTAGELALSIEDELFAYMRERPQVTVSVVAFNSRKIFITGQVAVPGRYAFEQIPGLAEVLGIAGGALPGAQLSDIRIVRTMAGQVQSITVDLQRFLQGADSGSLPPLLPGDLVYVPGASGFGGQAVAGAGSNVAYVFGQVARPGAYPVTGGADLVEVLALAGGATPIANLKRVQVVARDGGVVVAEVDVEAYLASGATAGFPVRAGDTINVPTQQVGVLNKAWGIAGQALSLSRDVLNAVLIIDYFN